MSIKMTTNSNNQDSLDLFTKVLLSYCRIALDAMTTKPSALQVGSADKFLSCCTSFYDIFVRLWHIVGHLFIWVVFAGACSPRHRKGYES